MENVSDLNFDVSPTAGGMAYFKMADGWEDTWLRNELLMLRQDFEDAEEAMIAAKDYADQCEERALTAEHRMNVMKTQLDEKFQYKNKILLEKVLVFSDLIEEYQRIHEIYARKLDVSLTTNKLNNLRRRGGYPEV